MTSSLPDAELCELFDGRLKLFQKPKGYRFSVDSVLLGDFARERAAGRVIDLGTGSGVLAVILSKLAAVREIVGIEVQEDLAALAQKNISYNECGDRVTIIRADIREIKKKFPAGSFDAVISNPPFYPVKSGLLNEDSGKAVSRHELHGTLADFLSISAYLLKISGAFLTIYPCSRLGDLIEEMRKATLEPKTLRFIHPKFEEPANLVLAEGIKGAGRQALVLPPLTLYDADGGYSRQAREIFRKV
ncbi:MAG: tRNA1(Val) (adenine(37)-N6)-methyltransferase [Proteobacteria bacterium]|nr:tRNA1(Val) (adenine(37)-N6)-methyltransferase [Pseudomonadota bacterium]